MKKTGNNKLKIFNDPVYGFINVPDESIFDLIETPFFQRLRHIKQLGLSHLVYPGALHTRFHHAMGSMYLMGQAIEVLRSKGHEITESESLSATQAILLHDLGHGPYSHTLEHALVSKLSHEELTGMFMQRLHDSRGHHLEDALRIFRGTHPKKQLHQLVSGQLDMDRLDYLNRDSFFTGVSEGVISWDRIIKMLNIAGEQLVIDEKGIYSIEKFIIARRLMYWQVYLHKTVIAAENILMAIMLRARELALAGERITASAPLLRFLGREYDREAFRADSTLLEDFSLLDDYDIFSAIKHWTRHSDPVLGTLSRCIVFRKLFRIELRKSPVPPEHLQRLRKLAAEKFRVGTEEAATYFVMSGRTRNKAYEPGTGSIYILSGLGELTDVAIASDQLNINVLSQPVEKHYVCYPKELGYLP